MNPTQTGRKCTDPQNQCRTERWRHSGPGSQVSFHPNRLGAAEPRSRVRAGDGNRLHRHPGKRGACPPVASGRLGGAAWGHGGPEKEQPKTQVTAPDRTAVGPQCSSPAWVTLGAITFWSLSFPSVKWDFLHPLLHFLTVLGPEWSSKQGRQSPASLSLRFWWRRQPAPCQQKFPEVLDGGT